MVGANPQPEIIIFTHRKTFIEPAKLVKQPLRHHNRRRTHQAKIETWAENIAGRLSVFGLGVHPHPATNPDLFGLADLNFRMLLHERRLDFQFSRHPKVVRIQERYILTLCTTDAVVARGRHPAPLLGDLPHIGTKMRQMFRGAVSGAVIDNNKLPRPIGLYQNRFNSLPDHRPTVIGGDNDAYDRVHSSTQPIYPDTGMKQPVLASSLNKTLYFLKKLIHHHLGDSVEHSLPDTGYQSSHLRIRTVFKHCLPVIL